MAFPVGEAASAGSQVGGDERQVLQITLGAKIGRWLLHQRLLLRAAASSAVTLATVAATRASLTPPTFSAAGYALAGA